MNILKSTLDTLKKDLVDTVEKEQTKLPGKEDSKLILELKELFPLIHNNQRGGIDKLHVIWARALRDALWLGWLSEAKKRRNAYSQEIVDAIEESLSYAFSSGKEYAKDRP